MFLLFLLRGRMVRETNMQTDRTTDGNLSNAYCYYRCQMVTSRTNQNSEQNVRSSIQIYRWEEAKKNLQKSSLRSFYAEWRLLIEVALVQASCAYEEKPIFEDFSLDAPPKLYEWRWNDENASVNRFNKNFCNYQAHICYTYLRNSQ